MNHQFDLVVIGDSKEGNIAVKNIATAKPYTKIAFISREFKNKTTHDFLNVEYIKEEVIFTDYKNRLFGCYLKNNDRIYSTHLVIATGLKYSPFVLGNKQVPCVFNTLTDIPKQSKSQPAVVVGNTSTDVKFALSVAKKYKQVYLCANTIELDITEALLKKLNNTKNLVVLPNASITKFNAPDGVLMSVDLDNYSKVTCSAIFIKTTSSPETSFVSDKLISKETGGYLKATNTSQSLLVPKCFAVGSCAAKSTKKMIQAMIEEILNDF